MGQAQRRHVLLVLHVSIVVVGRMLCMYVQSNAQETGARVERQTSTINTDLWTLSGLAQTLFPSFRL